MVIGAAVGEVALMATIKSGIAVLAKPVAEATFTGLKSISKTVVDLFSDRLAEYVSQQYKKHECLSTIVFQHQKSLNELYVPLTLISAADSHASRTGGRFFINKFPAQLFPDGSKVLITDTAGMGKSTLSKYLFLECLKENHTIPFFIELRHLTDKIGVLEMLVKQMNPVLLDEGETRFTKRQIQRMLKKNKLLFFFDGYDEIIPLHREAVTKGIKELVEVYPHHGYVITSRPETGLLAFPVFRQFNIKPLTADESYGLIRKYDEGAGRSEQLIKTLEKGEYSSVREFLKNPLLCSLLYRCFEYKQSVPLKKHVFYRQVYDALYDWHDSSKDGYNTREKRSGLDIDAFHRMLRVVGFYSVMTGKIEGDRDIVLSWIRKAKNVCNFTNLAESNFLEDLIRAVPLFVREGDLYRWSHKSLSEYFAAQYICTEGKIDQKRTLEAIMASKDCFRFANMLDQIYDVDNNAFREYLVLPTAKAFKENWEASYRKVDPSIEESEVKLRRSVTFDRKFVLMDEFDFPDASELRDMLKKIGGVWSAEFVDSEMLSVYMGSIGPLVAIEGKHCLILSILSVKKDNLIINSRLIDAGQGSKPNRVKSPVEVLDDPSLNFNSPEHFAKMTRYLTSIFPTPNSDNMLKFANDFKGVNQLASLTDELLNGLTR